MVSLLIFTLALIVLYILSRIFIQKLYIVLYRLTRSHERAFFLLSLIFLPGTFVHEISHFITALFLLVPVGELNLIPEIQEDGIRLGSVKIGETDFIRGTLIGIAPFLVGGSIIFWLISFALMPGNLTNPWIVVLLIYTVFEITHTMFSSKSDLYSILELVVFVTLISAVLVALKIFGPFEYIYINILAFSPFIQKFSYFLFIPIGLEIAFLGLFRNN